MFKTKTHLYVNINNNKQQSKTNLKTTNISKNKIYKILIKINE